MKSKSVIVALILLVAVNTAFAWEQLPLGWDFLFTLFLAFIWLLTLLIFLWKLVTFVQNANKEREYGINLIILGSVLLFCFLFPLGIIKSSDFDSEPYLIASREGAANCTTTITLGIDSSFVQRSVCFGVEKQTGTYTIKNDTVFLSFRNDENRRFGVIEWNEDQKKDDYGYLNYYGKLPNDKPLPMSILYLKK